jgi:hypothetical protein
MRNYALATSILTFISVIALKTNVSHKFQALYALKMPWE